MFGDATLDVAFARGIGSASQDDEVTALPLAACVASLLTLDRRRGRDGDHECREIGLPASGQSRATALSTGATARAMPP